MRARTLIRRATDVYYGLYRRWHGTTEVTLTLPMSPRLWRGHNGAVAIVRGPLVYSLKMGEDWRRVHQDQPVPRAAARRLGGLSHHAVELCPRRRTRKRWKRTSPLPSIPVGDCPFSPDGAPVSATVKGRRLPEWGMDRGSAADAPQSPVASSEPLEELTLIPYGCTNLRITEFPVLERKE